MAELREILEKLCVKTCDKENYTNDMISQSVGEIKSLFKSKLPQIKIISMPHISVDTHPEALERGKILGSNQVLTEIEKRWEEI